MIYRLILCLALSGCSAYPVVHWPRGPEPAAPALFPLADLAAGPGGVAEARGAALAAQAAALKVRARAIRTD